VHAFLLIGLVLLAGWGLWSACRTGASFVIRITDGVARADRGQVTRSFVREVGEVCRRHGVRHAEVRGRAEGRRIVLAFSRDMPETCRQQLRNIWNLSGWSSRL